MKTLNECNFIDLVSMAIKAVNRKTIKTRDRGTCLICERSTSSGMDKLCENCSIITLEEINVLLNNLAESINTMDKKLRAQHKKEFPMLWKHLNELITC